MKMLDASYVVSLNPLIHVISVTKSSVTAAHLSLDPDVATTTSPLSYVYLAIGRNMDLPLNAAHNNLCCALTPFITCTECGFTACTQCDMDHGSWTLDTHNLTCIADNSRWDNENYRVIIYKDTGAYEKTPTDVLTWRPMS